MAVDERGEDVMSDKIIIADATESSKERVVVAEVCSSQTGL